MLKFTLLSLLLTTFSFSLSSKKDAEKLPAVKKVEKDLLIEKVKKDHKSYDTQALKKALTFYRENLEGLKTAGLCFGADNKNNKIKIRNTECLVVADYSKTKLKKRLLILNPKTGESELFYTAHGKGSNKPEERETGLKAVRFSNKNGSNMTSLGFYLTDNLYNSYKDTFGPGPSNGLKLDGLNCSNNKARQRYIVMHTARYVPPKNTTKPMVGNSEGCVTLPKERKDILERCKGGALVYAHADSIL